MNVAVKSSRTSVIAISTAQFRRKRLLAVMMLWAWGVGAEAGGAPLALPDAQTRLLLERAVHVKPHPRQVAWQELEFTCFIHFGVNTFTGHEWGSGKESPALFIPTDLDTDQWVRAARDAGMKLVMITAKHHDGFCLWPSAYTEHDVANSPWRGGRGDVLADLSASAAKGGLKLGVYLSPADLHEIERTSGYYGNGSKAVRSVIPSPIEGKTPPERTFEYVVDDYNRYFLNQLYELLTRYKPMHEVWFDGANPKPGTGQTYNYEAWYDLIRHLAPQASIVIKGPDARWCGNEAGKTRRSEWSVFPIDAPQGQWAWPDWMAQDLGSRAKLKKTLDRGGHLHWYPAEVDTSIRHGWFWRDKKQTVRSSAEILDIWYRSVGGNCVLLLNVPPDRRGRFADRDVKVLRDVGRAIRQTFAENLAAGATVTASATRSGENFDAKNILDGDTSTCWMTDDWASSAEVVLKLPEPKRFNRAVLQEQIAGYSQRIEEFAIDAWVDGKWTQLIRDTTVGYKRICRFDEVTTDRVRIRILASRVCPTLSTFGLFVAPSGK